MSLKEVKFTERAKLLKILIFREYILHFSVVVVVVVLNINAVDKEKMGQKINLIQYIFSKKDLSYAKQAHYKTEV